MLFRLISRAARAGLTLVIDDLNFLCSAFFHVLLSFAMSADQTDALKPAVGMD